MADFISNTEQFIEEHSQWTLTLSLTSQRIHEVRGITHTEGTKARIDKTYTIEAHTHLTGAVALINTCACE